MQDGVSGAMSKGRPYPDDLQALVAARSREKEEIVLSKASLRELGHGKRSLIKVIRSMCLDCMGGAYSEIKLCTSIGCPLWPYRMGSNPYHTRANGRLSGENNDTRTST